MREEVDQARLSVGWYARVWFEFRLPSSIDKFVAEVKQELLLSGVTDRVADY